MSQFGNSASSDTSELKRMWLRPYYSREKETAFAFHFFVGSTVDNHLNILIQIPNPRFSLEHIGTAWSQTLILLVRGIVPIIPAYYSSPLHSKQFLITNKYITLWIQYVFFTQQQCCNAQFKRYSNLRLSILKCFSSPNRLCNFIVLLKLLCAKQYTGDQGSAAMYADRPLPTNY